MKETGKKNRLIQIMKIPARAFAKARNLYVKSMNSSAKLGCFTGGPSLGFPAPEPLPRSFTTSSRVAGDDVLSDLIRAHADVNSSGLSLQGAPRSASVGMARIDENEPCEFGVDDFPMIRSYAFLTANRF